MTYHAMLPARLLLALVFVVAGATKLLDRGGSRRALAEFGVPERLLSSLAVALPLAECTVGAGLIGVSTVWPASIGALSLLSIFTAGIAVSLIRGCKPDCHCFGQLYSAPAGVATLLRNALLAGVAAFLVWNGRDTSGADILGVFTDRSHLQQLGFAVVACLLPMSVAQCALLFQLVRQQGRLLLRLEAMEEARHPASAEQTIDTQSTDDRPAAGLPIGAKAPAFTLANLDDAPVSLGDLLDAGTALLLIFTNPKCGPCTALMPEITHWCLDENMPARIVLITEGTAVDNLTKFAGQYNPLVLRQNEREVAVAYQAHGTPAAVLIRADGTIGRALALGADAIRRLVQDLPALHRTASLQTGGRAPERRQLPVIAAGPAQPLFLRDREGNRVPVSALAGTPTLLLFWNSGCGYCQRMRNDLLAWDAAPPLGMPKLVVVVTTPHDQDHSLQLRAPIMVDSDSSVSAAFGTHGTPTAILLDADARPASDVAVGAHAVFALANPASGDVAA